MMLIGDPVFIVVSREEVEAVETSSAMSVEMLNCEATAIALPANIALDSWGV
jgi:hypothetical protein